MDTLSQTAEDLAASEMEIEERLYQPRLIWGYFLNWIRRNELKDGLNLSQDRPTLLTLRKSENAAYQMHNHILYWKEDVSDSYMTNCDQDELWVNSDDLGEVQGYISSDYPMTYPLQWNSFEEFIREICNLERI